MWKAIYRFLLGVLGPNRDNRASDEQPSLPVAAEFENDFDQVVDLAESSKQPAASRTSSVNSPTPTPMNDSPLVGLSLAPETSIVGEKTFICIIDQTVAGSLRLYTDPTSDGLTLVIESFVCEQIERVAAARAARVRDLLSSGDVAGLYRIDDEFVPFYCPKCDATFCGTCWMSFDAYEEDGWFDSVRGRCPKGHERRLVD